MNVQFRTIAATLFITTLSATLPAMAQDKELSVEEITEAFRQQKTRGLVIIPNASTAATATADAVGDDSATTVTAAQEYNPVDAAAQISVQISFDFDSATLRADQKPKLANMCQSMKLMDGTVFQIIGHTDSSGSAAYNERLSLLRAQEVRRHLISECGIADTALKAIGMGETAPIDTANPRADQNRRVEFQALG